MAARLHQQQQQLVHWQQLLHQQQHRLVQVD
jgi:hypothetical protein